MKPVLLLCDMMEVQPSCPNSPARTAPVMVYFSSTSLTSAFALTILLPSDTPVTQSNERG